MVRCPPRTQRPLQEAVMSEPKHRPIPLLSPIQIARFWSKVAVLRDNECWLWNAFRNDRQYGMFGIGRHIFLASRVAFVAANGVDPAELEVLHQCDNPPCCNPFHLFLGTHQDNMDDTVRKGRRKGLIAPSGLPKNLARGDRNGSRTHPEALRRGEQHPDSVITEKQVREIRALRQQGKRFKELAEMYGMTVSGINQIVHRRTWNHVV